MVQSAKNWCFTINNPTAVDNANLDYLTDPLHRVSIELNYVIYQLERGEEGTPHYQGYLQFNKRRTITQIKAFLGFRVHLEVAKGSPISNKEYCSKSDGRVEGPYEHGIIDIGRGKRNDIEAFVNDIRENPLSTRDLI